MTVTVYFIEFRGCVLEAKLADRQELENESERESLLLYNYVCCIETNCLINLGQIT